MTTVARLSTCALAKTQDHPPTSVPQHPCLNIELQVPWQCWTHTINPCVQTNESITRIRNFKKRSQPTFTKVYHSPPILYWKKRLLNLPPVALQIWLAEAIIKTPIARRQQSILHHHQNIQTPTPKTIPLRIHSRKDRGWRTESKTHPQT